MSGEFAGYSASVLRRVSSIVYIYILEDILTGHGPQ